MISDRTPAQRGSSFRLPPSAFRLLASAFLLLAGVPFIAGHAPAAEYPSKPIRLVVPYPPGASTNDILGRAIAIRLAARLGQQVVVDNRSGASGTMGSEMVAKATPDGYTLLVAVASPLAVGPSVYSKLGYDPVTDFAHIARVATIPYVMAVNLKVPAKDIREFIALAKSQPGKLNFASSGTGGSPHLCSELFKVAAGVDILHIPYKGAGIATIDLLGGQVQMFCTGLTALSAHIKAGRLRALGVASLKRSALMPDVPTIAEQGLPGFEVNSWTGVVAPAKTPPAVVKRLYAEIAKMVEDPEFRNFLHSTGAEPALMGPDEFRAYIKADIAKYAKVVKAAGIKPE